MSSLTTQSCAAFKRVVGSKVQVAACQKQAIKQASVNTTGLVCSGAKGVGQRGFTLIELVMVILILGVLSVYAAPRMFNSGDFYARGFHDETLSILRYAQKAAIAQRRLVCVAFTAADPATATLSIAAENTDSNCTKPLTGPNKNCEVLINGTTASTACIKARSDISYSGTTTPINFNGLGQPLSLSDGKLVGLTAPQAITVANNGAPFSKNVTVEAETGYVHD